MKKWSVVLMVPALLMSLVLPMTAAAQTTPGKISHIYAFGDSSIDTGRGRELTTKIASLKNPPKGAYIKAEEGYYWNGRYSNGKVYVELLAEKYGVGLTNYAVGGAKSGPDATGNTNWSGWLTGTGGIEQTKEFVSAKNKKLDPNALYFISIGGNDTYNLAIPGETVKSVTAQSAANIEQMITDLADAGAKKFAVMLQSRKAGKPISEFQTAHRAATQEVVKKAKAKYPGIEILTLDIVPLMDAIEKNPSAYGYKTLSYYMHSDWVPDIGYGFHFVDNTKLFANAPKGYPEYNYDGFKGYDKDGIWNADEYFYFDEYHITRTTHKHIYDHILPQVEAFLSDKTTG